MTKKLFVISLTITTIAWMVGGIFVAKPALAVTTGSLIKTATASAVYYVGDVNGVQKKYVFPDEKVYFSWYSNFSSVQTVSQETLQGIDTVGNVVVRAGTKLVQFVAIGGNGQLVVDDPKVYAVSLDGTKHWITTATIAATLYGANWETKIYGVPNFLVSNYTAGADIITATYPEGALVKLADNSQIYYINATGQKQPITAAGFTANWFQDGYIMTAASLTGYPDGTSITAADPVLIDVSQGGISTTPIGSGLTVAKATDSPVAATIVSDGSAGVAGSQANVGALKLNFTAASDGVVKVTTLKLKRMGINATTDMDNVYLFDVDGNWLASHQSITTDYITFANTAGLFTVAAGTTKPILVKFNLNKDATSGKTIGMKIDASTDIVTDGAAVNGTFPMEGNLMTVASVSDFGRTTITSTNYSATMDPSTTAQDLWQFSLAVSNQKVKVEKIIFTNVGSIESDDITDLQLFVDGVQLGTTVAGLSTSNKAVFDNLNYDIDKVTKTVTLKGKVIAGSSRTFRFSIQNVYDITLKDMGYNVYLAGDNGTIGSWTVRQAGAVTTINEGSLTISKSTTSPVGPMAAGLTNVIIAKYDFTAVGEDMKVNTLYGAVTTASVANKGMDQIKFMYEGTQVGTTQDATGTIAWTNLGGSFVVPAGTTKVLDIVGNTKSDAGINYIAGTTFYFTLNGSTIGTDAGEAQRMTSLTTQDLDTAYNSNTITVATSDVTVAKNGDIGDYTSDNPTGVVSAQNVMIASWNITGSTAEAVNVTQIKLQDVTLTTGNEVGDFFTNIELHKGLMGTDPTTTRIGSVIATPGTTSSQDSFTFTPSSVLTVGISETVTIYLYGDVKSNAAALTQTALVEVGTIGYNYALSGSSTTLTSGADGQMSVIMANGSLVVIAGDSQVPANIVTMSPYSSSNIVELAKFKATTLFEPMNIEKIVFNNTVGKTQVVSTTNATSSLVNYTLWNGTTQIGGYGQVTATATPVEGAYITFNISPAYQLPIGTATLTLKAKVNSLAYAAAGSTNTITLRTVWSGQPTEYGLQTVRGAQSNASITSVPAATVTGNTMIVNRAMPIVTPVAFTDSERVLTGQEQAMYKFTVTPSGDGSIRLKKMTFNVTLTDTATNTGALDFNTWSLEKNTGTLTAGTDYFIYDGTGTAATDRIDKDSNSTGTLYTSYFEGVTQGGAGQLLVSTGTIVVIFASEDIVSAATTYTLKGRANDLSSLAADQDRIVIQMVGSDDTAVYGNTPPTSGAYFLDADPIFNYYGGTNHRYVVNLNTAVSGGGTEKAALFIWSDNSKDVVHSSTVNAASSGAGTVTTATSSQDWFSGYKVRTSATTNTYLPLDSITMAKG